MSDQPSEPEALPDLPPSLKWLKWLVMVLLVVMIVGFVLLITMLISTLNADPLTLPDQVTLPEGHKAQAFTQGSDWFAIVTDRKQIIIFDRSTGDVRQTIYIED